jgi:predicted RecA/RadA family phage recombinase
MQNFVQEGEVLTLVAPYDVVSGAGMKVGSIFAVASGAAAGGAAVEGVTCGVFDLPKVAAQAWTLGAKVHWDDTAKLATTTATGNTLIGVAVADAANPSSVGRVRLNGTFGV